jgi:hypothetical protein
MCEILQMGAHTVCWYGGRFCLWAMSGKHNVLFLVCILCIVFFFKFCNYSCALCANYSPPQIRDTCAPN